MDYFLTMHLMHSYNSYIYILTIPEFFMMTKISRYR